MKRLLIDVLHKLINGVIRLRHDITFDTEEVDWSAGPYVILANHVNNWDPFFVNVPIKDPISFVASERFFHIRPLGFFLNLFGAVPKMKSKSDLMTIRLLLRKKAEGRHIGIFAEGRRSWDGRTLPLVPATAKLVKMLKMPVVAVEICGGALAQPRWADAYRRGPIHLVYRQILTAEAIKDMDAGAIHDILVKVLDHDESAWQKSSGAVYRGKRPAERLERFLYACPSCGMPDGLRSQGDTLRCIHCGAGARYKADGTLDGDFAYREIAAWHDWETGALKAHLAEWIGGGSFTKPAVMTLYDEGRHILLQTTQEISLASQGLQLDRFVPFSDLSGANIQSNNKLEFHIAGEKLVRLEFEDPHESVYKWLTALEYHD